MEKSAFPSGEENDSFCDWATSKSAFTTRPRLLLMVSPKRKEELWLGSAGGIVSENGCVSSRQTPSLPYPMRAPKHGMMLGRNGKLVR